MTCCIPLAEKGAKSKTKRARQQTLEESNDDSTSTSSSPLSMERDFTDKALGEMQSWPIASCGNGANLL